MPRRRCGLKLSRLQISFFALPSSEAAPAVGAAGAGEDDAALDGEGAGSGAAVKALVAEKSFPADSATVAETTCMPPENMSFSTFSDSTIFCEQ